MCPIMKLKKIMQSIGMALFVAMTANWSQAELLMYEGFPTSETGYNMAATDIAKIIRDVPVITDSRVIGFKPEKWSFGTGIIYVVDYAKAQKATDNLLKISVYCIKYQNNAWFFVGDLI